MTLVVIQRGHVPRTSGATGAPGEQQFARDTAAKLAPILRGMGHGVRVIDADERRSRYAGDLFVAIHYDSSGSSSASGASVGYQTPEGATFAAAWKRAYVEAGWTRGFRPDNYTANLGQYYGVREAVAAGNRRAIITESGFQTNTGDRQLMSPERTARSIAAAVAHITRTPLPEEDDVSAQDVWSHRIEGMDAGERLVLTGNRALRAQQNAARAVAEVRALAELAGVSHDALEDRASEILAELKEHDTKEVTS